MYKIFLLLLILKKYLTDLSKINIHFVLKHTLKYSTNSPFSDLKISLENIIRTVYLIGFEYAIKRKHVGIGKKIFYLATASFKIIWRLPRAHN